MKVTFLYFIWILSIELLTAKEIFTQDKILDYMEISNPFVYTAIGNENIFKHRELYHLGSFDTEVSLKYDEKEYPVSDGKLLDIGVNKVLENGTLLSVSYRKAQGIQEYNNIKTNNEGEILAGINLPLVSLMSGMNSRKLDLNIASVNKIKLAYESKNNLRLLYHKILSQYIAVLYFNSIVKLQDKLLNKAKKRKDLIKKRVESGFLAQIALLEAKQQIINREQTLRSSENSFAVAKESFVLYLNISKEKFLNQYTLLDINEISYLQKDVNAYIEIALENRKDIKIYDLEIQKVHLRQKQTNQLQYPNIDLSFYGIRDFKGENGYKAALSIKFPLERRKYEGQKLENRFSKKNIKMQQKKEIISVKTNLKNIFNSLRVLEVNIENSLIEIELVKKLEESENKKYLLGSSNLFMVNQREIYTLDIQKKRLDYNYRYLSLILDANSEAGIGGLVVSQY
ncbi:MAG: TolC family protein [Sulfurimonas sp.]|nr:TolC family protein [Sulfurimonas sp.]